MAKTRGINAYHVILAMSILYVLFGAWRLIVSDFERENLIVLGLGVVLGAGALSRMRKERQGRGSQ